MAGYIGPVPTPQATQSRDYFTATAGQTSFPTSGYTPGYLDVYLNGVHLQDSDFTATNGSDVVLNDPCAADDVVLVVAWSTFEATNVDYSNVQNTPTNVSDFTNDAGYATTSYVDTAESDAVTTANAYTDTAVGNVTTDLIGDTTPQLGGNLDTNGNDITFGDNDKAVFGAGSDLQIYHDGSNSYVEDSSTGAGELILRGAGNGVSLRESIGNEPMLTAARNGAVTLYYDNAAKLATTSTGVSVTGTVSATSFSGDGSNLTGIQTSPYDQSTSSTGFFALPKGTTAQRPSSPQNGYTRYNTTLSYVEYYTGGAWYPVYQNPNTVVLEYLAVAGGGCGGSSNNGSGKNGGGGGGAGGAVTGEADVLLSGSFTVSVVIGAGGTGATGSNYQSIGKGSNSTLSGTLSQTMIGGGYGGNDEANTAPIAGGSGGGGGATVAEQGASGTVGQGNNGGNGVSGAGGGGGGKGAAGAAGVNQTGGNGGSGFMWEDGITYAGGGGGGGDTGGSASDGGGPGTGGNSNGTNGSAGRGGGGGAAGAGVDNRFGGNGGSGVVIFRYQSASALFTGGTITSSGGYQYHKFTSSGTFAKI
jgi:hypothetical protein